MTHPFDYPPAPAPNSQDILNRLTQLGARARQESEDIGHATTLTLTAIEVAFEAADLGAVGEREADLAYQSGFDWGDI